MECVRGSDLCVGIGVFCDCVLIGLCCCCIGCDVCFRAWMVLCMVWIGIVSVARLRL